MEDFSTFFSAVIDDKVRPVNCVLIAAVSHSRRLVSFQSFARIKRWLDHAKSSPSLKVLAGGNCDDSKGYFVEPTIVEATDPQDIIMCEVCVCVCVCIAVCTNEGGACRVQVTRVTLGRPACPLTVAGHADVPAVQRQVERL